MKRNSIALVLLVVVLAAAPALAGEAFRYTYNVQKVVLDNGVTLLLKENPAFDIIALTLLSRVGTIQDPAGLEGLTYLTQRNLLSGTVNRTALELITELESLGVQLLTATSHSYSPVFLQALPDSFPQAFAILLDVLNHSTFPPEELERERELTMATVRSLADDPINAAFLTYLETFYGDHPFRNTAYGSLEGLAAVRAEDLREWKQYIYAPENLVVAVVGNFHTEELLPQLEAAFGPWQPGYEGSLVPRETVPFSHPPEDREVKVQVPMEASFVIMGYPAPDTFDPDSAAMAVINTVLGMDSGSRLWTELRENLGLVYLAFSAYDERVGPSNLYALAVTHPAAVETVKEQIRQQVQRFITEGLTEEEIAAVAAQRWGGFLIKNETNLSQAVLLAQAELSGRGYAWVDEYMNFFADVTPEDTKRVAEKYFQHYTSVVVGP